MTEIHLESQAETDSGVTRQEVQIYTYDIGRDYSSDVVRLYYYSELNSIAVFSFMIFFFIKCVQVIVIAKCCDRYVV